MNSHCPLSEKTALLFEAALGIDSELLMRLQAKYNMLTIKQDISFMECLAKLRDIANLPHLLISPVKLRLQ